MQILVTRLDKAWFSQSTKPYETTTWSVRETIRTEIHNPVTSIHSIFTALSQLKPFGCINREQVFEVAADMMSRAIFIETSFFMTS